MSEMTLRDAMFSLRAMRRLRVDPVPEEDLRFLHRRKTGELFRFSCWAGAVLGRGTEAQAQALGEYGETLGLAFQVVDDVLDELQDQTERADDAVGVESHVAADAGRTGREAGEGAAGAELEGGDADHVVVIGRSDSSDTSSGSTL